MKTLKLRPLVMMATLLAVVAAACTGSSDDAASEIEPGAPTCEVTDDDSFFRVLYVNDSGEPQRLIGEATLTLTNGGEHFAEVRSEAVGPDEVLRESFFSAKPIGTTVADCTAELVEIETTDPPQDGLDDLSECTLGEGEYGDFVFELTVTNNGDDAAYYNGQIAVRNDAGERIVTGYYLLTLESGVIRHLDPGETLTETFSALGALYSPDHSCELLSAARVGV